MQGSVHDNEDGSDAPLGESRTALPRSGVTAQPLFTGTTELLRDCVGGRPGERLLIVEEPLDGGYFDHDAPRLTAEAARRMGLIVYLTEAPTALASADAIAEFIERLRGFDHVVFFARVGDQLRFSELADLPPATMCYTLGRDMLESAFGSSCYRGLCEVRSLIDEAFSRAHSIHVSCPRGTDYHGQLDHTVAGKAPPLPDVSLKRFPMLVPRPVSAHGFSGRVVLSRFLTGTGSRFYEPYHLPLPDDITAIVRNRRLLRFEGPQSEVDRVNAHYMDIAGRFDIDPWYVHSWHAGIHPACSFPTAAASDLLRWSGSAFGNPRILHFHTCGDYAPGEISWIVVDPTVSIDGVALWEAGRLHPERLPGGGAVMKRHPRLAETYLSPERNIGLAD